MTLIRTIIRIFVKPQTMGVANGVQSLDVGIGVLEQDAFAAGVVPDANVAADQTVRGWVWRDRIATVDAAAQNAALRTNEVHLDLRGQRRIGDGELALMSVSSPLAGATYDITVLGLIRCLFKM